MGMSPIVIPMFSRIWNVHIAMIPATMSEPNRSRDCAAISSEVTSSAK